MSLNVDRRKWKRVKFGDVVTNVNENVKDPSNNGIERSLGLEHLDPRELKVTHWGSTSEGGTFTRRVKPGETLFGKRRAYQRKTAYAEFDAVCSGDILVFATKNPSVLLPDLLPFLASTDSFYDHALQTSAGSLSPRTKWTDLAKYEFLLPRIEEQRRIAELLWSIERHLLGLRNERATCQLSLDKYRDEKLWGEDVSRLPLMRFAAEQKITDGDWIESKDMDPDGSVRLIQLADIGTGMFLDKSNRWINEKTSKKLNVNHLHAGDILISRMADPIGRACILPALPTSSITAVDVAVVKPAQSLMSGELLVEVLSAPIWLKEVAKRARGTTRSRVSRKDLEAMPVPAPSKEQQQEMLTDIRHLRSGLESIDREIASTKRMKETLSTALWGGA